MKWAKLSTLLAFLILLLSAYSSAVQADEPQPLPMEYRAKFVCGKTNPDVKPLAPGNYFTSINIHNPIEDKPEKRIAFDMKIVVDTQPIPGIGHTDFGQPGVIDPDNATEINCQKIIRLAPDNLCAAFCEGFVVIRSLAELDVVAIYSAADTNNNVATLSTDHVLPHCPIRTESLGLGTEDFKDPLPLFIPPKANNGAGDSDFDGNGPCVNFDFALQLEDGDRVLVAKYRMSAFECDDDPLKPKDDFTRAEGTDERVLKVASPRGRILGYNVDSTMSHSYVDTTTGDPGSAADDSFDFNTGRFANGPVTKLVFVGDTSADDAGTITGVRITLRKIDVQLESCAPLPLSQTIP